jgi:hypothetical protein
MVTKFSIKERSRKELAEVLADLLGTKAKYQGVPTCAYRIGETEVELDGTVDWGKALSENQILELTEKLETAGFSQADSFTISFPDDNISTETLEKLYLILRSKGELIKKALGADRILVTHDMGSVNFPWFDRLLTADEARIYTEFISLLVASARAQMRVLEKETRTDNEKYTFRCFLLRLGYIGDEFKEARKMLLKNFEGSSAFRSPKGVK